MMNRLAKHLAALSLGGLAFAAPLQAQGAEFSLGGSVGIPTGDFDDFAKVGWHGLAAVSYVPPTFPVGFQVDGNFAQFSDETDLDVKDRVIFGTANAVYKFNVAPDTRFRPYLIGGGGVYNTKLTGDDIVGDPEDVTDFGVNAGAGFDFKAGNIGLFVEGRFHNVFTDGDDTQFIPVTLGIRLGGT